MSKIVERVKYGARGQGSLIRYADSASWTSCYYAGGTEHRESTDTSDLKKARAWHKRKLDEIASHRQGHAPVVTPAMKQATVHALLDALFASPEFTALKGAATARYHAVAVRAHFGTWRAVTVTSESWDAYIAQRRALGRAPATINRERSVLLDAFGLAVARKKLHVIQVPTLSRLPERNVRRGFFERHEYEAVVTHAPAYLQDVIRFAYASGWRLGEIRSLTWAMVDRTAQTITLPDSKNDHGRVLPLDIGELAAVMQRREPARLITRGAQVLVTDLLFHRDGHPIGDIRKAWAKACIAAKLCHVERDDAGEAITVVDKLFHDFRRTAVRNLVRSGVDPTTARAITGHRTAAVFSRYNIIDERDLRRALTQRATYEQALPTTAEEAGR